MLKIAYLHNLPLEYYPPASNLVDILGRQWEWLEQTGPPNVSWERGGCDYHALPELLRDFHAGEYTAERAFAPLLLDLGLKQDSMAA